MIIESKAFRISRKNTPVNFPLSIFSNQLSHICIKPGHSSEEGEILTEIQKEKNCPLDNDIVG